MDDEIKIYLNQVKITEVKTLIFFLENVRHKSTLYRKSVILL